MRQTKPDEGGAEFESAWLGAQRSASQPYWHWLDGAPVWKQNYTNWDPSFKYSDASPGDVFCLS